jgi:hypothetical protein
LIQQFAKLVGQAFSLPGLLPQAANLSSGGHPSQKVARAKPLYLFFMHFLPIMGF